MAQWRRRRRRMILCPSVVVVGVLLLLLLLFAIQGPEVQLSKPLELHLLARRILLPLTNAPPPNNTPEILNPSNMVAPSISPPPRNLDFDVSPSPYGSSSIPHTKEEASSPLYFKEPPKEYAPAPATISEENNLSPKPVFHGEVPYTNSSVPVPSKEVSPPLLLQPPTIPPSGFPHTSDIFPHAAQAVISSAQPSAPPYESPPSRPPNSHDLSPSYVVPPSVRTGNGEPPKISSPGSVPENKAPASSASRFHGNRYGSPIASPPKEPSTSLSPPSYLHLQGPAASSASTPNVNDSATRSIPVAAPPKESFSHSSHVNSSRVKGHASSPVSSPHVNNSTTHSIPGAAPPKESSSHSSPVNSSHIKAHNGRSIKFPSSGIRA